MIVLVEAEQVIRVILPASMALAVCLYIMSYAYRETSPAAFALTGVILFAMIFFIQYGVTWFAVRMYMFRGLLLLYMFVGGALLVLAFLRLFLKNGENNRTMVVMFSLYMLCLLYITVFMRDGTSDTSILINPVSSITKLVQEGSVKEFNHMGMNMVMFMPFGFFISMIKKEDHQNVIYAIAMGLMLSSLIESVQLETGLGQCDMNDVFANALGSGVGNVAACVYLRFGRSGYYVSNQG